MASNVGYTFTLTSASYSEIDPTTGHVVRNVVQPFEITLAESDTRISQYLGNPCFSSKATYVETPHAVAVLDETKVEDETQVAIPIGEVPGIPNKVVEILVANGFTTAEKILSEEVEVEHLTQLQGIGETTANKIIEACEAAVAEKNKE